MYYSTSNTDGTVSLWYPDGDLLCRLQDNLGLDIYAKELAPKMLEALNREAEKADRLVKLALSLLRDVPPFAEYDWSEWITAAQLMGYDVGSTWEADEATREAARKLLEGKP